MPDSIPVPCKLRRGTGGSVYWWDGLNPPTILSGGVGSDLNAVAGTLTVFTVTAAQFDAIDDYCFERFFAFADLAACGVCPIPESAKSARSMRAPRWLRSS